MMGYQSGDDGMPGRGGVTTLMSHQSGILHSLIFLLLLTPEMVDNKIACQNDYKNVPSS